MSLSSFIHFATAILVAPYWNLNLTVVPSQITSGQILVAPYWNLNRLGNPTEARNYIILVAPYWNLNDENTGPLC